MTPSPFHRVSPGILLAAAIAVSAGAAETNLPLKQVVLFTSGVAYFERAAEIAGPLATDLTFTSEQIADLIKSLVLMDAGGAPVKAVTYESRDPVERTLKSFAVDLTDNPDLGALLNRARGVAVRVKASASDWTGRSVGVETRSKQIERATIEEKVLTLLCDGALRAVPLDSVQSLELLDPAVQGDLEAALLVLAGSHARDKKRVHLAFADGAKRSVRVAYMLEAPVWKTSYRLVLDDQGGAHLQGWAHVENMTDETWDHVALTLVSGQPLSFIQNLYDPIYRRRPVVQMALGEALAPPEYENVLAAPAPQPATEEAMADAAPRGAFKAARMGGGAMAMAAPPAPVRARLEAADLAGGGEAAAEARAAGELFEYPVSEPVTLPRRQSAMIPIVNRAVRGTPLSIFNAQVNARHPLNGLEFENTSGLFLMQGPVTVFAAGIYAGDARLPDTPRGERRLLAYAVDLACEGKLTTQSEPEQVVSVKIARGTLTLRRKFVETAVYTLNNKREAARLALIEHPLRPDWTLVEPAKDVETTRDAYRYRTTLAAAQSRDLVFQEERVEPELLMLSTLPTDHVRIILSQKRLSERVRQALAEVVARQEALEAVRRERQQQDAAVKALTEEQARIRQNMQTVQRNAESYAMWERKLVQQEQDLDRLRQAIAALRADENAKAAALAKFLADLDVE